MLKLNWRKAAFALVSLWLAAAIAANAQTLRTLVEFDVTNGSYPNRMPLVQGLDGNLYGTAVEGGNTSCFAPSGCGTIFKMTPTGDLTTLFTFDGANGGQPSGLVLGTDGDFYGSSVGGIDSYGTLFKITAEGKLTTLHSFTDFADGGYPVGLASGTDGNLYGATAVGGSFSDGTLFRTTPGGRLTTLHAFTSQLVPQVPVVVDAQGNVYGTGILGGSVNCQSGNCGTVFRLAANGIFTTLYDFSGTDGAESYAALIQGSDGNFYGTTAQGGSTIGNQSLCFGEGCGTVFRITPDGNLTTLYNFCMKTGCTDGAQPAAALVLGTDGNFYGTTGGGGTGTCGGIGCGTIFRMSPAGVLTTLHTFDISDGSVPNALTQDTSGVFYGTTSAGGSGGYGTIFSISVGLGPFVETLPVVDKVGATITILGTNLTGATSVTFNGTAATFRVVSSSLISATVPTGATTGPVQVVTPSRTLTSNVNFQVEP